MKRYDSLNSLKKYSKKKASLTKVKPSYEGEIKKFINLLKTSVINNNLFMKDSK